jgi:sulfatase maturation enzyme AslB (radical SAM superfamily)
VKDIKKNGKYTDLISDSKDNLNIPEHQYKDDENNPYIKAFWKWWYSDLQHELNEIRITGGEPLMAKSVWKLFEWFKDNPEKGERIRYAINSNLVPKKQETLDRLVECSHYVKKLEIYTSNESHGKHSEYIRDGMKYDLWLSNIRKLIEKGNIQGLHVMMTINSLCLDSITEFMDDMLNLKREFGPRYPVMTLNILRFPSFQSIAILPDDIKNRLIKKLRTWYEYQISLNEKDKEGNKLLIPMEREHIERVIDYLTGVDSPHSSSSDRDKLYHDFRSFYRQYDRRRGKDFRKTFSQDFVNFFDGKQRQE